MPVVMIVTAGLSALLSPPFALAAAVMASAATLVGLSPTWYFTGTGEPAKILLADSVPRLLATAGGTVVLSLGGPLAVYPALLIAAAVASPWIGWRLGRLAGAKPAWLSTTRIARVVRFQLSVLSGRIGLALYTSLPLTIVAAIAPGSLAVYSAADRLQRSGLQLVNSVNLQLTGWVGQVSTRGERERRARSALWMTAVVGAASSGATVALAGPVSNWLFSGVATIPMESSLVLSGVVAVTIFANGVGRFLLIRNDIRAVNRAVWTRVLVGCGGVAIGASTIGVLGALVGLLLGEIAALLQQVFAVMVGKRGRE